MAVVTGRVEQIFPCERCGEVKMVVLETTEIFDDGSSMTDVEIVDPGTCEVQGEAKVPGKRIPRS